MIKGDRLDLVPLKESEVELIRQWRMIHKESFYDANDITPEQQRIWYKKYKESPIDRMYIITLHSGEQIGTVALYEIDIQTRSARLGRVLLLEDYRGHGYAEEAVKLMLSYADNTLRLYRVTTDTYIDNIDAIAVYARSGFKTTIRPIIILERVNANCDRKKPVVLEDE
jgi:RimJ/RimL family protein N-acetyltransferase